MANTPAAGVVDSNFNAGGITPDGIYFVRNGQTIFYPYDALGGDGASNSIWRPTVSPEGEISWQRSMEATAPDPQNIKGPPGTDGAPGPAGSNGKTWKPAVSETGELSWSEDESGTPPAPVNIKGDPGTDAELPAGTMGDLLHHNGTDWVAEDPGTALAPNQRVGDLLVATASGGVEWMPEENAIPGIYADVAPIMTNATNGYVLTKMNGENVWLPRGGVRIPSTTATRYSLPSLTKSFSTISGLNIPLGFLTALTIRGQAGGKSVYAYGTASYNSAGPVALLGTFGNSIVLFNLYFDGVNISDIDARVLIGDDTYDQPIEITFTRGAYG